MITGREVGCELEEDEEENEDEDAEGWGKVFEWVQTEGEGQMSWTLVRSIVGVQAKAILLVTKPGKPANLATALAKNGVA